LESQLAAELQLIETSAQRAVSVLDRETIRPPQPQRHTTGQNEIVVEDAGVEEVSNGRDTNDVPGDVVKIEAVLLGVAFDVVAGRPVGDHLPYSSQALMAWSGTLSSSPVSRSRGHFPGSVLDASKSTRPVSGRSMSSRASRGRPASRSSSAARAHTARLRQRARSSSNGRSRSPSRSARSQARTHSSGRTHSWGRSSASI